MNPKQFTGATIDGKSMIIHQITHASLEDDLYMQMCTGRPRAQGRPIYVYLARENWRHDLEIARDPRDRFFFTLNLFVFWMILDKLRLVWIGIEFSVTDYLVIDSNHLFE